MDNKAQMMVLESIFFAITVVIALAFLIQMSPSSIQSASQSSNELKELGDDALRNIYSGTLNINDSRPDGYSTNNPSSKLVVCLITNDYYTVTNLINSTLPDTVLYNIYISNGSKTVFWCSQIGSTTTPLFMNDPVAISHYEVIIHPYHLSAFDDSLYNNGIESVLVSEFIGDPGDIFNNYWYKGASYDVILEMSDIWIY